MLWFVRWEIPVLMLRSGWCKIRTSMRRPDWCGQQTSRFWQKVILLFIMIFQTTQKRQADLLNTLCYSPSVETVIVWSFSPVGRVRQQLDLVRTLKLLKLFNSFVVNVEFWRIYSFSTRDRIYLVCVQPSSPVIRWSPRKLDTGCIRHSLHTSNEDFRFTIIIFLWWPMWLNLCLSWYQIQTTVSFEKHDCSFRCCVTSEGDYKEDLWRQIK